MADRLPRIKWPRAFPLCALLGVAIAVSLTAITAFVQLRAMQPLQRLYIGPFLKASVLPIPQTVELIEVYSQAPEHGYIMAIDPWISVSSVDGQLRIIMTNDALGAGLSNPRVYVASSAKPQSLRPFFEHSIYHGSVSQTFRPTIVSFCVFFAAGLFLGAWFDQQHQEAVRRGIQIRGPRLIAPKKAQRYLKGDGIALFLEPKAR